MIYYEAFGATKKDTFFDERKFFNKLIAEIFKTTQKGKILKCSRSLFFGIAQNIFFLAPIIIVNRGLNGVISFLK